MKGARSLERPIGGSSIDSHRQISENLRPLMAAGNLIVPIIVPMRVVGDRTTSVAPLPTFSGWPGSDPHQYLSQFFTAWVTNNGRTKDI